MPSDWHVLLTNEITDAPGRMESSIVSISPRPGGRWLLVATVSYAVGLQADQTFRERFSTREMVKWALDRDAEHLEEIERCSRRAPADLDDGSDDDSDDDSDDEELPRPKSRSLGPVSSALRDIADQTGAQYCVRLLDSWAAGKWPKPPRPPRVLAILGPRKRQVWRGIFHNVIAVTTDRGEAYMYPGLGSRARVHFGGQFQGHTVRLSQSLQDQLRAVLAAHNSTDAKA